LTATLMSRPRAPERAFADRRRDHLQGDRNDQAGLLGERDEDVGRDVLLGRVAPTQERLGADDDAGAQVDLRLEVGDELAVLERAAQVGGEREAGEARVVLLRGVAHDADGAFLRLVHRDVGALHERLDVVAVVGMERDADAAAELEADALGDERLGEGAADRVGDLHALGGRRGGAHQDAELVAAEAGDGVARVEQLGEPAGHLAQDLIAVVVAERVVDVLEAVEVDEHHDDGAIAAVRGRDRAAGALREQHAVRQAGERVVRRQAAAHERVGAGALHREQR
jgi:hypothetical protein